MATAAVFCTLLILGLSNTGFAAPDKLLPTTASDKPTTSPSTLLNVPLKKDVTEKSEAPLSKPEAALKNNAADKPVPEDAVNRIDVNATLDKTGIHDADDDSWEYENKAKVQSRRIMKGKRVATGKRPYMVYLQLSSKSAKMPKWKGWVCAGVIVNEYYVLTSAACVEDAEHFYVVAGTAKFVDACNLKKNCCAKKHRRKVVWKCMPKNYKFNFDDLAKWASNDLALVKVDRPFKIGECEAGCDYSAEVLQFNNISRKLEDTDTKGYIVGWGSNGIFREGVDKTKSTSQVCMQEAKVYVMDKCECLKQWSSKFKKVIEEYMFCTKDMGGQDGCSQYGNCTKIEDEDECRRMNNASDPELTALSSNVDLGRHLLDPEHHTARRSQKSSGGFCQNDHGGPLIVKCKCKEIVVGIITACKIDASSHRCTGPFLYTSVFKNKDFLNCAINKDDSGVCRRVFRTGVTHEEVFVNWENVTEDIDDEENTKAVEKVKVRVDLNQPTGSSGTTKDALRKRSKSHHKKRKHHKKSKGSSGSSESRSD